MIHCSCYYVSSVFLSVSVITNDLHDNSIEFPPLSKCLFLKLSDVIFLVYSVFSNAYSSCFIIFLVIRWMITEEKFLKECPMRTMKW
jgi:hypothetical protein